MKPIRVQRKRTKGWRMPEDTVYVGRPTYWGNHFIVGRKIGECNPYQPYVLQTMSEKGYTDETLITYEIAVELFERDFINRIMYDRYGDVVPTGIGFEESIQQELTGKNLCCWCPLEKPCHVDVLLKFAN